MVVGAQRIYGCKIQRRDMSRLRTISETILALERRVYGLLPGPMRPQVDHPTRWSNNDKTTPAFGQWVTHCAPSLLASPFLELWFRWSYTHISLYRYRSATIILSIIDIGIIYFRGSQTVSRAPTAQVDAVSHSIELFRDMGVPARDLYFTLIFMVFTLYAILLTLGKCWCILMRKQFGECTLGGILICPPYSR